MLRDVEERGLEIGQHPAFLQMWQRQLVSVLVLLFLDAAWIAAYMRGKYQAQIRAVQTSEMKVRLHYAVLAYLCMSLALWHVVPHIRQTHKFVDAVTIGGSMGVALFGTFAFTNAAVLSEWSASTVVADVLWGFVLYATAAYVAAHVS